MWTITFAVFGFTLVLACLPHTKPPARLSRACVCVCAPPRCNFCRSLLLRQFLFNIAPLSTLPSPLYCTCHTPPTLYGTVPASRPIQFTVSHFVAHPLFCFYFSSFPSCPHVPCVLTKFKKSTITSNQQSAISCRTCERLPPGTCAQAPVAELSHLVVASDCGHNSPTNAHYTTLLPSPLMHFLTTGQ